MGLVANGYRLGFSPFSQRGGGLISIYGAGRAPRNWALPGRMRGLRYLTSSRSGLPHGGLAGTSWMLPQVAGAIVSRNLTTVSITATGDVAQGRPVAGSASLSISAAGDVYGVGAVAGSASLSISATGDVYGVAAVAGSASLSVSATGSVNAIAAVAGSATMTISASSTMGCLATVAGTAQFSGSAEGDALTADGVASAVWAAAAASNTTSGTMGELLNGAGGGSSPGAVADAVWASAARTLTSVGSGITDDIANAVRAALAVELARIDAAVTTRQAAGTVNANITAVNGVTIGGSGTTPDPWGPA